MRRLVDTSTIAPVAIATDAGALAVPPAGYAIVPASWSIQGEVIPELEVEIWGSTTIALTNAVLYGGVLHPLVYADQTVTGSASTNRFTKVTHNLAVGDGPFLFTNATDGFAGGTDGETPYWVSVVPDVNTFKVALSLKDALAGLFVDLTADSTGTTKITDTADTERVYWQTHDGLLGLAGNGAIALTTTKGYSKRIPHSPRVVAYALVATIDTGTVSAQMTPIVDVA